MITKYNQTSGSKLPGVAYNCRESDTLEFCAELDTYYKM